MHSPAVPSIPLKVAVIGAGQRSRTIYQPLFSSLRPWFEVTAVCDPVRKHADAMAGELGVPAYYDIRELVRDRPMEAALVVTPIESHHSISVWLSAHGIHHFVETSFCSMVAQGRDMIATARANGVVTRVAENFYHFPVDRFARQVKRSGYLGRIGRIVSYNDHTGYHNNSRWIAFAGAHPLWVQAVGHTMGTARFQHTPERIYDAEHYTARHFLFPDNFFVTDHCANIKGFLGRMQRPGYTEWQGERGALVHRAAAATVAAATYYAGGVATKREPGVWSSETELRLCSDEALGVFDPFRMTGFADHLSPVVTEYADDRWIRTYAETAAEEIAYVNPFRPLVNSAHFLPEYGACVMGPLVDFALAVRGLAVSEFTDEDALMSLMMEVGAEESELQDGRRIALPMDGELEADRLERARQRSRFGVDPLDAEAMLQISYPKP